jgi:hypothetical protein
LADENSVLLPLRLITIPAKFLWNITSAPQKELNNRTFKVLGGAVVGSGSAVNAMVKISGSPCFESCQVDRSCASREFSMAPVSLIRTLKNSTEKAMLTPRSCIAFIQR